MGRDPDYLAFVRRVVQARTAATPLTLDEEREQLRLTTQHAARDPVGSVTDVDLPDGDGRLRRGRLYRPVDAWRGLEGTCLVFVHGGGWCLGDVETWDPVVRTLVTACRIAMLSVETRQAPEHPYPAAVDDAVSAVRRLRDQAAALGLDAGGVGLAGDSSGGNVAAAAALRLRDEGDERPVLQLLVYPPLDVLDVAPDPVDPDGLDWGRPPAAQIVAPYLGGADPTSAYVSPLRAPSLGGLPPAVLVTAEHDRLAPQARAYAGRLAAADVPVSLVEGRGLDHAFVAWTRHARRPREAVAEIGEAVRRMLLSPPS